MLDQRVSPITDPLDIFTDIFQCIRVGRIETVIIRDILIFIKKQTDPDTRADTFFLQLVCKTFHIRKSGIAFCPGSTVVFIQAVMLLPAIINDHERRIFYTFGQFQDIIGIT